MPARLRRFQQSGQTHFLTFSCYHRRPLMTPQTSDIFLSSLEQTRIQYKIFVYAYVVMPEHVHLLVSEPEQGALATALMSLKRTSSHVARHREGMDAMQAFWQKRYYDRNIRDYEDFMQKMRYIHRNPVKRGLCIDPQEWRWSSCRHYATGERGPVEIESKWTSELRTRVEEKT